VGSSCFVARLEHYLLLTPAEREAVSALEGDRRAFRRGEALQRVHNASGELMIVDSGWLASCTLLPDGSRQIIQLHLPGELAGLANVAYAEAAVALVALTDAKVCPIQRNALGKLFDKHPRLAGLFFALAVVEHSALADRLVSVGRTSARARIAALMLDTHARLRVLDNDAAGPFAFPLTQEEIGDATGLTAVHVNRMIRQLEDARMIARGDGRIRLIDEPALRKLAAFEDRYEKLSLGWLPPSR
jgi:CRP/FNR family transcriptional regulator, anaerobic regulatory protein